MLRAGILKWRTNGDGAPGRALREDPLESSAGGQSLHTKEEEAVVENPGPKPSSWRLVRSVCRTAILVPGAGGPRCMLAGRLDGWTQMAVEGLDVTEV